MAALRIATFNVLFGGETRMAAICEHVRAIDPDVLVLQECLEWDACERLGEIAAAMGVPATPYHAYLGMANRRPSGRRFNVALLSRLPILAARTHTRGMAHCLVEAQLDYAERLLTVLGTHLISRDESGRMLEISELIRLVPPEELASHRYVLAGDLNAIARHDPYPADLDHQLRTRGIDKYGHPPQFAEVDRLIAAGWIDPLATDKRATDWVTARRKGNGQGEPVETRTDYVLLSPPLVPHVTKVEVVDIGDASDHNPVIVTLD